MSTPEPTGTVTVKLPAKHASDWYDRCGIQFTDTGDGTEVVHYSQRTLTLVLSPSALRDLRDDAIMYATDMGPNETGDLDYRPAARRCLAALARGALSEDPVVDAAAKGLGARAVARLEREYRAQTRG